MKKYGFSDKLREYLANIEEETEKEIKILESPKLGLKGMWAGFRYHPDFIIIIIRSGIKRLDESVERTIAHEATHGHILFKYKYCMAEFNETASDNDRKNIQLIFTTVDDLVVNKIISENGFRPFGDEYLRIIQKEIDAMISGHDFYRQFSDDLLFDDLLMISRYIIAWGFLEYFELNIEEYQLIEKFTTVFKYAYPVQYSIAEKIKQIIIEKDIFTSAGHCKAMDEILELLKFKDLVKAVNLPLKK